MTYTTGTNLISRLMMKGLSWKRLSLSLAIVIVLNLFFNVGVRTFYPAPKYENYCPAKIFETNYETRDACVAAGGAWRAEPTRVVETKQIVGSCDANATCQKEYNDVQSVYNRNVLLSFSPQNPFTRDWDVSSKRFGRCQRIALRRVAFYVIATIRFWSNMDDYVRFVILGIVLAFLISLGSKTSR